MVQLNAAATKKANLVTFVKELGVVVAPNDTIPILQKKGALAIYDRAPASPEDPVGFGMHAAKTYQEILVHEASYQRWVIQTFEEQEGQACARLCRLARWLLDQRAQKDMTPMNDTHAPAPITREGVDVQGLQDYQGGAGRQVQDLETIRSFIQHDAVSAGGLSGGQFKS